MTCRHWEVLSELTFNSGGTYESPESYRPWGMVEADTKREARALAIKLPEFREHVLEMRGDGKPPFSKITVQRCECPHGVCWECSTETIFCDQCDAEFAVAVNITAPQPPRIVATIDITLPEPPPIEAHLIETEYVGGDPE